MKCPKCGELLNIVFEMSKWLNLHADEVPVGEPAMLNVVCENCKDGGIWLEMIPYCENKEIMGSVTVTDSQENG